MSEYREFFPVLRISREDVTHAIGYDLEPELTDDQMERIADKFGDALQCLEPWNILADVCDILVDTLNLRTPTRTITIELRCPRDSAVVRFALYAEDFGPGYGLVANMALKHSVFEEFVSRLEAEVRDDPNPASGGK